jgi:hypothetical protein
VKWMASYVLCQSWRLHCEEHRPQKQAMALASIGVHTLDDVASLGVVET